jgi:VCBS repeat-containing protein
MRTSSQESVQSWINHAWNRCNPLAKSTDPALRPGVQLDMLEPRLCFSATPLGADLLTDEWMFGADHAQAAVQIDSYEEPSSPFTTADDQSSGMALIFIDGNVEQKEMLIEGLTSRFGDEAEIHVLDTARDGLDQITEIVQSHHEISAVHILSHGTEGQIQLGNITLSSANLDAYASQLSRWSDHLHEDADILFYGCDLAGNDDGESLVDGIAGLTLADVAASNDKTGAAKAGGDWELEFATGTITTDVVANAALQANFTGTLDLVPRGEQIVNQDLAPHPLNLDQATDTETSNSDSAVAFAANGTHVVVWTSANSNGDSDVLFQLFDANSEPVGEQQLATTKTADNQHSASVAMAANGDFVVVWTSENQDGSASSVFFRRFDVNGVALSGELSVYDGASVDHTAFIQRNADIAMNLAGDFAITWGGQVFGENNGIAARTYNLNGTPVSDVFHANATFGIADQQQNPSIAIDANSNLVIGWNDNRVNGGGTITKASINGGHFDRFGSPGTQIEAPETVFGFVDVDIRNPSIDMKEDGTVAVAYEISTNINPEWKIEVQVFNPALAGAAFAIAPEGSVSGTSNDKVNPSIWFNEDDTLLLTWEGFGNQSGEDDTAGVFARVLTTNGATQAIPLPAGASDEFRVNQTTAGAQGNVSIAGLDGDNFAVVWTGNGADDNNGVYIRQFGTGVDAVDDTIQVATDHDKQIFIDRLFNNDISDGTLTLTSTTNGTGSVVDNGDGTITYTPSTGFTGNDSFTYTVENDDGVSDTATVHVIVIDPTIVDHIWVTEESSTTIDEKGGTAFNLPDPSGGSTTDTIAFDLDDFGSSAKLEGIHYVSQGLQLGDTNSIQLEPGDIIGSLDGATTLGGINFQASDVFLFEPTTPGDNTAGTFTRLLQNPLGVDILALSLIETDTDFADTTLEAGTFLFTRDGDPAKLFAYRPTGVGASTAGTANLFFDGTDSGGFDLAEEITAIEVIEQDMIAGNAHLREGQLILSFANDASNVGNNNEDTKDRDFYLVDISATQMGSGQSDGTISEIFDGSKYSVSNALSGVSFATIVVQPPIAVDDDITTGFGEDTTSNTIDVLGNDTHDPATVVTFDDSGTRGTVTLNGDNTFNYSPNGAFDALPLGTSSSDSFTYTITDPSGLASTATVTVVVDGANDDPNGGGYGSTHSEDDAAFSTSLIATATDPDDGATLSVGGIAYVGGNSIGVSFSGNNIQIDPSAYDYLTAGAPVAGVTQETVVYNYDITDGQGGSTTVTATVVFNGSNDAPVLDGLATLTIPDIFENSSDPNGTTVAAMLSSAATAPITDVDDNSSEGIAVIGADSTNGDWEFSLNNGSTWTAFSAAAVPATSASATNAVLLAPTALIRFVPQAGFSGAASPLQFVAWDQTIGNNGDTGVDASSSATSAFSAASNTVSLQIIPVAIAAIDDGPFFVSEDGTLNQDLGTHLIGWQARREITVDNTTRAEALNDFPLLVRLDATTIDYGQTQNLGQDLRFLDSTGNLLDYEIESWDEAGESTVWVRVPTIDANSTATITMYYGNTSAAAGQTPASVWSDGYQSVYHFSENANANGDLLADTVSGLDGSNQGSSAVSGLIGGAQSFDGSDYVDLGTDRPFVRDFSAATLSAWVNTDSLSGNGQVVGFLRGPGGSSVRSRLELVREGNEIAIYARTTDTTSGSQKIETTTGAIQTGQWHQVVGTVDFASDTIKIYIDGQEQATTGTINFSNNSTPDTNSMQGTIGVEENMSLSFFRGDIDEVRVASVARSAAWINAQYEAAQGSMVSIGNEESTGGILANDSISGNVPVTAVLESDVSHGTLALSSDGSFTYTPNADFFGSDSFTYSVTDGTSSSTATVQIQVNGINDDPIANDDTSSALIGMPKTISVLSNDIDVDSAFGTVTIDNVSAGSNVTVNPDGTVEFLSNTLGTFSFTYQVDDVDGATSNVATVTVTVSDVVAHGLWISTSGDSNATGAPGLDSWLDGEVIQFDGSTYDLVGATTDGTFASVFDVNQFGVDANITALQYISRDFMVGSGSTGFSFQTGDVMFAIDQDATFTSTNTAGIETGDFALFRPDVPGDYRSGQFFEVYDSVGGAPILNAATVVEQAVSFGAFNFIPGDLLFAEAGDSSLFVLRPSSLGDPASTGGTGTAGSLATVLTGSAGANIDGLELIERTTQLGDVVLDEGTLLMSIDSAANVGGPAGSRSVEPHDIFAFSFVGSDAKAELLFDADDVQLAAASENVDAIALNFGPNSFQTISGTVYEDVDGDGNVTNDGVGAENVLVKLYRDNGNGTPDGGDTFITSMGTLSNGQYSFSNLRHGEYYVIVDSTTITPSAGFNGTLTTDNVWAEQTFGSAGSLYLDNDDNLLASINDGTLFGGRDMTASDNANHVATAEHIIHVDLNGGTPADVDFGFSFNVVTNTSAGDAQDDRGGVNEQTVQGSLRQFITNANNVFGANAMRFVPAEATEVSPGNFTFTRGNAPNRSDLAGNSWWQIGVSEVLPNITDIETTIDGTAYNAADGTSLLNTNQAQLGFSGQVGIDPDGIPNSGDEHLVSQLEGVELELIDTANVTVGLDINANNTVVQRVAIHGFGDASQTGSAAKLGNIVVRSVGSDPAVQNTLITDNVIGSGPDQFARIAADHNEGAGVIIMSGGVGTVRDNVIGFGGTWGVRIQDVGTSGWLVEANSIVGNAQVIASSDGIEIAGNSSNFVVRGNYIADNQGAGIDSFRSPGSHFYGFNTIENNGAGGVESSGVRVYGNDNNISFNRIRNNSGAGVLVVGETTGANGRSAAIGNQISQNAFENNGGLAIDLRAATVGTNAARAGDGVTANDGTTSPTTGNEGFDFPVFSVANLKGTSVDIVGTAPANALVEIYLAAPNSNDMSGGFQFGEGAEYIGTVIADATGAFSTTLTSPSLTPTSMLTAIAIDTTSHNTSEFSQVIPVLHFRLQAQDDVATVNEGGTLSGDASTNDITTAGSEVTYTLANPTTNGTLVLNPNGTFTYDHDGTEATVDSFDYVVTDNHGETSTATVTITITNQNDPPIAGNDSFSVVEDGLLNATVSANDSDAEDDTLAYTLLSPTTSGTVNLNGDGTFTYSPNANFHGTDTFSYEVSDGNGGTHSATVTIEVTPENDAPTGLNDAFSINEDTTLSGNVATNDFDIDGNSLTFSLVDGPTQGTLQFNVDGTFSYAPNPNFNGFDTFRYQIDDGAGGIVNADVTIDVLPINDPPVAVDDSYSVNEDLSLTDDVSTNDTDPDSSALTFATASSPSNGSLTFNPDGTFTYTPDRHYTGADSFSYTVTDGVTSTTATVHITVDPINDIPVAGDDLFQGDEDTTLTGFVGSNDIDVEDATLSFALLSDATQGTLIFKPNGTFAYTPAPNFHGTDSFRYEVADSNGATAIAEVSFVISPVNDLPKANDDFFTTAENRTLTDTVTTNDADVEEVSLTYSLTTTPSNGTVTINPDGSFVFTPERGFVGVTEFDYTATDSEGGSATATVQINVMNVNEAPVAANDSFTTNEDTPIQGSVAANDIDPDNDRLTFSIVSFPARGDLQLNPDGSFVYTPEADHNGTTAFRYRVSDDSGLSEVAVAEIVVAEVNDAPVAQNDEFLATSNSPLSLLPAELLANDSDIESDGLTVEFIESPTNGQITQNPDGTIEYTPDGSFVGIDTFTYVITDGEAVSAPATVSVTVLAAPPLVIPPNTDAPIEEDANTSADEAGDTPAIGALLDSNTTQSSVDDDDSDFIALLNDSFTSDDSKDGVFLVTNILTDIESEDSTLQRLAIVAGSYVADGVELTTPDRETVPELEPVELAELSQLDFATYFREGESYFAISEKMDQFRQSLDAEMILPELAVEGIVAATSSFSVGAAFWLLRGGYIVASVISALPAWQTFDPIPILAYAMKEEGEDETVESLMGG